MKNKVILFKLSTMGMQIAGYAGAEHSWGSTGWQAIWMKKV